jgi:hypothetical protein
MIAKKESAEIKCFCIMGSSKWAAIYAIVTLLGA